MSLSRSYLLLLATLGAIVLIPSGLGWTASVVQSESMAPHISTGDVVLAPALPASSPTPVGGVITFHVDGRSVVHRVVSLNDDNSIVTAGDANAQFDPWSITRDDITGQARLLVPYVGLPGMWVQRGDVLPLAVWLVLTAAALIAAAPASAGHRGARRPARHRGAHGAPVSIHSVGAATLAGVLALGVAVVPMAPVDAAFSSSTRSSSSWKARAYSPITVGALAGFGAVAATSVSDTSLTSYQASVVGDVATTPGTAVNGFRDSDIDTVHKNDQAAKNAMAAATSVRAALLERPVTRTLPAALAGTLTGGVYASTTGAFSVGGTLTLDAKNDPSARFVFRTTTTLTMAQRSKIVLVNGAQPANVWWIVGTTATLGTVISGTPDTTPVGNYLVTGNALFRGVLHSGRVVSFTGALTLNGRIAPTN